ncbi:MAG: hypothetical protein WAX89_03635 [Alphaproteobacteria bacterium]
MSGSAMGSGSVPTQPPMYAPQSGYADAVPATPTPALQSAAAGQQVQPYALAAPDPEVDRLASENEGLKNRLERLERAMIRLDRRMQLIERNELGRMSGFEGGADERVSALENDAVSQSQQIAQLAVGQPLGGALPARGNQMLAALGEQASPPAAAAYPQGITPVAARQQSAYPTPRAAAPQGYAQQVQPEGMISSSLQAAPRRVALASNMQVASNGANLPSLADAAGGKKAAENALAVWTVSFDAGKIWPNRDQLPASRDVVEVLRQGKPKAIFARGAEPTSKEFRERVRALSRYLGKVTDMENVAISTMPAQHMDGNTIEVFATR